MWPCASPATRSSRARSIGAVHVQECAPEYLELKRELFGELDALSRTRGGARELVLGADDSARSAGDLPGRARCLVVHPANPPHLLPIVELVPAPFTDAAVIDRTRDMLERAGMSPVLVRQELEGFVYNRLQGAVLREAYCLVRDGVISVDELDRVVARGARAPLGGDRAVRDRPTSTPAAASRCTRGEWARHTHGWAPSAASTTPGTRSSSPR